MELKQDKETCKLSVISQVPTNWSDWGGLWTPCAGSVSPWTTHLGSEEYEPNGEHMVTMVSPVRAASHAVTATTYLHKTGQLRLPSTQRLGHKD